MITSHGWWDGWERTLLSDEALLECETLPRSCSFGGIVYVSPFTSALIISLKACKNTLKLIHFKFVLLGKIRAYFRERIV
jgi:hypothetical protein